MGYDPFTVFDNVGSPSLVTDRGVTPPQGSRIAEHLFLVGLLVCIVASGLTAALGSMGLWIVGYLVAVLGGVTSLGFYRQALGKREQDRHLLVTRLERWLVAVYAVLLLSGAAVNAVRLAVYWSGR